MRIRFTIRRLMVLVAVIATILGLLQNHAFATIVTFYVAGLALIAWFFSHGRSRVATWGFFASAAWLNLSMPCFFAYYPVFRNQYLLFFSSLVFVPIVPGIGLAWVASYPRMPQRIRAALTVVVLTAIPCSMLGNRWPFEVAFYVSSPGLNRLADRVESGGTVVPGEWAGVYRVRGAKTDPRTGDIVLVIDTDPNGIFAFARSIASRSDGINRREWLGTGMWYDIDED